MVDSKAKPQKEVTKKPAKSKTPEKPVTQASSQPKEIKPKEVPKEEPKPVVEAKPKKTIVNPTPKLHNFKLFDRWDITEVHVADAGLRKYINLNAQSVPQTYGRGIKKQFGKSRKSIVERLILKLMVAGHKGKKHYRTSGKNTGKYNQGYKIVKKTFEILENKTKQNPVQVFVDSICKGAPKEGVTTIEYGGVRYPKAVDLAPQRRVDLVLRWMTQGAHQSIHKSKKTISEALVEQILLTREGEQKANCIQKKFELERQSAASR